MSAHCHFTVSGIVWGAGVERLIYALAQSGLSGYDPGTEARDTLAEHPGTRALGLSIFIDPEEVPKSPLWGVVGELGLSAFWQFLGEDGDPGLILVRDGMDHFSMYTDGEGEIILTLSQALNPACLAQHSHFSALLGVIAHSPLRVCKTAHQALNAQNEAQTPTSLP